MLKHVFAAAAFAFCFATPADAQDGTLPPVDTMNCDQMMAEMTVAGQQMNAQMDPEFAIEAQRMMDEAQARPSGGQMAMGIGTGIACSIPGVGMACMAAAQAQAVEGQRRANEHNARMDAQMQRMETATAGIDMERMGAISTRFEEQECPTPQ